MPRPAKEPRQDTTSASGNNDDQDDDFSMNQQFISTLRGCKFALWNVAIHELYYFVDQKNLQEELVDKLVKMLAKRFHPFSLVHYNSERLILKNGPFLIRLCAGPDVFEYEYLEIQVDFEGRSPQDTDFHGIKMLLQQLLLKAHVNLSELSNLLIENNNIGSVLKQCEDDDDESEDGTDSINDVFGITSIVQLDKNSNRQCVQQLRQFILDRSSTHANLNTQKTVQLALDSNSALLINERFVNIPPQISGATFESLKEEIHQAVSKRCMNQMNFYIVICKIHKVDPSRRNKSDSDEVVWSNGEEEVICEDSLDFFDYSVKTECDTAFMGEWSEDDKSMTPYRRVMILDANKFNTIVANVQNFVS